MTVWVAVCVCGVWDDDDGDDERKGVKPGAGS